MTEKQINEQLVEDINRVFTIAGVWKSDKCLRSASCEERERSIEHALNAGGEKAEKIIQTVKEILDSCNSSVYKNVLAKTYIKHVYTLLNYRAEAAAKATGGKLAPIHKPEEAYDLTRYIDAIAAARTQEGLTVTGYRALEIAGSKENLAKILSKALRTDVEVSIENLGDPKYTYKEKEPYYSHKIWMITQLMPIVLVKDYKGL